MKNPVKKIWLNLLEILFPRFCLGCKREGRYLCKDCFMFLSEAEFVCPVCEKPSYSGKRHGKCGDPAKDPDGIIGLWDYDGLAKQAVRYAKREGFFHILEELAESMISLMERDERRFSLFVRFLSDNETRITFVPLHKSKEKRRGFNQSEILAGHIARAAGKRKERFLKRRKDTELQDNFDRKSRFSNVRDAFVFTGPEKAKKVLLIGDVWTSGATMKECCRILKESGVKEVWAFVIAKA